MKKLGKKIGKIEFSVAHERRHKEIKPPQLVGAPLQVTSPNQPSESVGQSKPTADAADQAGEGGNGDQNHTNGDDALAPADRARQLRLLVPRLSDTEETEEMETYIKGITTAFATKQVYSREQNMLPYTSGAAPPTSAFSLQSHIL